MNFDSAIWKHSGCESRADKVSIDRKTTVYRLEACEIALFENVYQAAHSNVFPYFTDLPVSSTL